MLLWNDGDTAGRNAHNAWSIPSALVPVAEATVPIAPLVNATVLLAAVVLSPAPVMTMEVALLARLAVLKKGGCSGVNSRSLSSKGMAL